MSTCQFARNLLVDLGSRIKFIQIAHLDGLNDSVPALWIMIALFKNTRPPLCQPADAFDDRESESGDWLYFPNSHA